MAWTARRARLRARAVRPSVSLIGGRWQKGDVAELRCEESEPWGETQDQRGRTSVGVTATQASGQQ
ncbi:hypothetical protein PsYK624_168080 [Phanerochaete sordida]|uniref:Uncharacterized protein n=1 Tax=Phanerochaete sordida TaxID=48140 RepID=A0A9P3GRH0_9APHY|nr:hypothetical protein PsYK624_168080 [Phanerochaete sordida]